MGFFSKLFGGSKGNKDSAPGADPGGFHFYVRCDRCGEAIHVRVNKATDIAEEYDGESAAKMLHKEILGSMCQNLMYVHLTLDSNLKIVESIAERCVLISSEDYTRTHQESARISEG